MRQKLPFGRPSDTPGYWLHGLLLFALWGRSPGGEVYPSCGPPSLCWVWGLTCAHSAMNFPNLPPFSVESLLIFCWLGYMLSHVVPRVLTKAFWSIYYCWLAFTWELRAWHCLVHLLIAPLRSAFWLDNSMYLHVKLLLIRTPFCHFAVCFLIAFFSQFLY